MDYSIKAVSPQDGRYNNLIKELQDIFSEYGFLKHRIFVETQWLKFLNNSVSNTHLTKSDLAKIDCIYKNFDINDALKIKEIEKTTNHDVKAVEYFVKEKLSSLNLNRIKEWVHFSCTSEDINNTSYALMLKKANGIIVKNAKEVLSFIENFAKKYKSTAMMSRTHGQPATPTTVGKEFINFAWKLKKEINILKRIKIQAKFNGATGNYNAHYFVFPEIDWIKESQKFIKNYIGLEPQLYSTQINANNYISELMHSLARLASILIDIDRDCWGYISLGYFKQKIKEGEVGSSTMPHKVNPIDFENSEGNMGLAIALCQHLAIVLLNSRFQRDLTDSTVSRNFGLSYGYILIGLKSLLKGLNKLDVNKIDINSDLSDNLELLAEPIQTAMRVYLEDKPYEKLKKLTRGNKITRKKLNDFIDKLEKVPHKIKQKMKNLTPEKYTGLAEALVDSYFKK